MLPWQGASAIRMHRRMLLLQLSSVASFSPPAMSSGTSWPESRKKTTGRGRTDRGSRGEASTVIAENGGRNKGSVEGREGGGRLKAVGRQGRAASGGFRWGGTAWTRRCGGYFVLLSRMHDQHTLKWCQRPAPSHSQQSHPLFFGLPRVVHSTESGQKRVKEVVTSVGSDRVQFLDELGEVFFLVEIEPLVLHSIPEVAVPVRGRTEA